MSIFVTKYMKKTVKSQLQISKKSKKKIKK